VPPTRVHYHLSRQILPRRPVPDKLLQDGQRWLAANNGNVADRYIDNEVDIIIEMAAGLDDPHYHLLFSAIPSGESESDRLRRSCNHGEIAHHRFPDRHADRDQDGMLVGATEIIQGPKGIIPSLVRLERAKQRLDFTWNVLAPSLDGIRHIGIRFSERKRGGFWGNLSGTDGSGKSSLVKCGSKVIDSVSEEIAKFLGKRLAELDFVNLSGAIAINLNEGGVGILTEERVDHQFEITNVFLCVGNSALWTIK